MAERYGPQWWRQKYPEKDWKIFEDFRYFLILVWRHLMLPDPTWVQMDIAKWLQDGPRRAITEAFRGVGKSWVTSAYVCWKLLRDPQWKIMVVSASKERADQFSTFTLRLINEMEILRHLIPRADQRQSKIAFDVGPARADHTPSVKSVGIFGQLTGGRANEIVADDVEVPNNSETQAMRDKLAERVKEFDAVLKPGGLVKYLGTPQMEESLYNQLPQRGYSVRIWTSRVPDEKALNSPGYGDYIAPAIHAMVEQGAKAGDPVDPTRFDDEDLTERELSYGRSGFALQFMLDTRLSDAERYPLKLSDLLITGLNKTEAPERLIWSGDPMYRYQDLHCVGLNGDRYFRPAALIGDWIPYEGVVMAIDPSGRGKDETTYAVVAMLNGFLYVLEAGGMKGGYDDDTLIELCNVAKRNKANAAVIESNFGDGMFTKLLSPHMKRIHPMALEEVRSNQQKEKRIIDTLEPVMNQHKLVVCDSVVRKDQESVQDYPTEQQLKRQLFYQMSRLTKDRGSLAFDDRIDVLAMAVAYWVEQMGHDEEERMEERQERIADAELELWHTGIDGISLDLLALGATPEMAMEGALMGHNGGPELGPEDW